MPELPVLGKRLADRGASDDTSIGMAEPSQKTPFKLSQLDLGSIGVTKRSGGRRRAAASASASASLDDDEDPLEEAQVARVK